MLLHAANTAANAINFNVKRKICKIYANVPKIANEKQETSSALKATSLNELMSWFQIQQEPLIWPKIAIHLIAKT